MSEKLNFMNASVGSMDHDGGSENENDEHIFHLKIGDNLGKDWVLLHNQSTLSQYFNADHLTRIHTIANPITVYSNAISTSTNQKGMFGSFSVWFNSNGIANVPSLKTIMDHYLVIYNSIDIGGVFI